MIKKLKQVILSSGKRMSLLLKLTALLLILGTLPAFAQQKRVSGKVTDPSGVALPGVNILEKGTLNGAISDPGGNFTVTVASEASILTFSFIGYETQEVTVGTQNTVNVTLKELVSALDEIVVVGYSTQARKTLTGAVATVDAAELSESAAVNPITRLQGKVAGVTILNQHTPGEGSSIRIRGMTTINDASPLYVVDGVPGGSYSPNDVENITILKDAAAQSIYGARAANGVVLITTKGGKKNQKVSMNVNVRQGVSRFSNYYDLLNTQEWGEMIWLEAANFGVAPTHQQYGNGATPTIPDYIVPTAAAEGSAGVNPALYDNQMAVRDGDDTYLITKANKEGTDWFKESTEPGSFKEYTIDVTGGGANSAYALMLGYTSDEGIFKWTGFERYNFRTNITTSPAKWIDIGTNIGVQYTNDHGHQSDNSESSMVSWCYRLPPIIPVYDITGTTYAGSRASGTGNAQNPVFLLDKNQYDYTNRLTASGNAFVKLNIVKGLSVKSLIGLNTYGQKTNDINFVEVAAAERGTYDGYIKTSSFGLDWTWTNTIEYALTTGQHNIRLLAGSEANDNTYTYLNGSRSEYPVLEIDYITINTGLRSISNSDDNSEYSLFSIFGRVNYIFADKYMFEGVVRRDGSSRFGTQKYGIFPAFSVGWRVSQEDFMASTKSWLDDLKLRIGYGVVGNDKMNNYNSYTQFAYSEGSASYNQSGINSQLTSVGYYQSRFGNSDVKWETTTTLNVGIDATLIKNLTVAFDVWQRQTKDMLYPKQLPLVLGTATRPSINIGEMKNTGFDLEIGYSNNALNGDLLYNVDFVFSHYKNELTKLTDVAGDFYQGSGFREKVYTRTETGRAFPEFYGYEVEGIFQTQDEVDTWPAAFGASGTYNKPGHFKYKDVDGNGYIDAADRTYIGSPHPDFTAGLSFGVNYKGISLSTTLYSSVGNEVVNYVSRFIDYTQFASGKSKRRLYESWGSPYLASNEDATMPIIYNNDTPHQEPSTAFLEDGSFLRMKTLRIGYDLNNLLNKRFGSLLVYFQASNLFTLTKYTGLDPELSIPSSAINMGIDSGAWPTTQQFLFGISFGI